MRQLSGQDASFLYMETAQVNTFMQPYRFAEVVVIIVALALAFLSMEPPFSDVLIAIMGLLPLAAAFRQNYAHRTADRELTTQYGYYYRIFSNAHRLLQSAEQPEVKRDILRGLGEAALDEQGQWILRQRERPIAGGSVMAN